jgi:thiol:disulfide interchange protein
MAKAHFGKPALRAAWESGRPIEIDTDTHTALASWQLERFGTQERPLYVRLEPDGASARWNTFVRDGDDAGVERLVGFLEGRETGGGDLAEGWGSGLGGLLLVAVFGGLFTLLMPCTYPMIPLTVSFFSKQADSGRRLAPLAACYAGGIVCCFTALGLVVSGIFEVAVSNVAGNPWTNLVIGLLFLVFGLSLLGAFLLRLPSGLIDRLGGARSGYMGAGVMGLTFAVTAFTCTAPVAGLVLGEAMRDGTWLKAGGTMAVYAATIALPFFFLALAPRALQRLPRAGAWMGEFKVVGGLVEIGAAVKFLAVADNAWDWDLLSRDAVLAIWAACALIIAAYLLGLLRLREDAPLRGIGTARLLLVLAFTTFGAYCAGGVLGMPLAGLVEGLIPYMHETPLWSGS